MRTLTVFLALCGIFVAGQAHASTSTIVWHVENPFRFFSNPTATELHRAAAVSGGSVLMAERSLAAQFRYGWAESTFLETCWHLVRQDHSACGGLDAYVNPRSHRISARFVGGGRNTAMCDWHFEALHGQRLSWRSKPTRCGDPVSVDVPYPGTGRLTVSVNGANAGETVIRVKDLFIVGLGDSYASGDGNPDRPVRWRDDAAASFGNVHSLDLRGYPERKVTSIAYKGRQVDGPSAFWLNQPCHRSLYSHQLRVALQLALDEPDRSVTFLGLSCSGAEITSGLLAAWKGVERFPTVPRRSQIGEAAVAQCGGQGLEVRNYASSFTDGGRIPSLDGLTLERCPPARARKIDLVLISIGGNDVGFAKLVAYAILQEHTPLRSVGQVYTPREVKALFPELTSRFKLLRRALHNHLHIPWNEPQRIVLTAYPTLAVERDGQSICEGGNSAGLDGFPAFRLDRRRVAEAEAVAADLNERLVLVARKYGWSFVSQHRPRFAGRGICAGQEAGSGTAHDELLLPRWKGRAWSPYRPSAYEPYAPRMRWIRTSNDAYMTSHVDLSSDLRRQGRGDGRYQPTDLLRASTFGGAFHPTAEGQAAIADAVLDRARRIVRQSGAH